MPSHPYNLSGDIAPLPAGPFNFVNPFASGGGGFFSPFATRGRGALDPSGALSALYEARPAFVQQQGALLQSLGAPLRNALFAAVPEIQQLSNYLTQSFASPIPRGLEREFQERIRAAQEARGFSGGTGPAGEEARFLTTLAEQRRQQLAPQLLNFGQSILGIAGLAGIPNLELGTLGSLLLGQRQFAAEQAAAAQRSAAAQQLFNQFQGGGGGGTPDFFARQSGLGAGLRVGSGGGGGTPDFFSRPGGSGAGFYGSGLPFGGFTVGGLAPTPAPAPGARLQGGGIVGVAPAAAPAEDIPGTTRPYTPEELAIATRQAQERLARGGLPAPY